jgi:hypothetical protein
LKIFTERKLYKTQLPDTFFCYEKADNFNIGSDDLPCCSVTFWQRASHRSGRKRFNNSTGG